MTTENTLSDQNLEQLKGAIEFAKQSITLCVILNGGALVALLTLLGSILNKVDTEIILGLAFASRYFIFGVSLATLSGIIAFLTQLSYFKKEAIGLTSKLNPTVMRFTLLTCLVMSLLCFLFGAIYALKQFTNI